MFVHGGPLHLIGNMLFLFLFGACVEDLIGRLRFIVFYLVGGLLAEIIYIGMSPDHFQSTIPMGGASGAISACMGMYLLLRANADIEIKYFFWLYVYVRAGGFEVPAWVAIAFWFGGQLFNAALQLLLGHGSHGGVAFGAHVGGFVGGLGLLAIYRKFSPPREEQVEVPTAGKPIIDTSEFLAGVRHPAPALSTSETPTIYLHDGYQQTGPYTLTAVQAMLNNGEINQDISYWSEGMSKWERVVDLADRPLE
jgi:membrane associated rhomboid family serine protease